MAEKEFWEDDDYDGIDDNIEILLEESLHDPNQAYIYIRIKAAPDSDEILIESDDNDTFIHTPNTDMVTVLSNGTESQLAMMLLELFHMDPSFMEAVAVAIHAMQKFRKE